MALARAIAADAEILVLADPTTAVDSVTEQEIAQRVARHRGPKPTLVSVSYTHLTLPTIAAECRSRWSPYH